MHARTVQELIDALSAFRGDLPVQTLRDHQGYEDGVTVNPDVEEGQVVLKFS